MGRRRQREPPSTSASTTQEGKLSGIGKQEMQPPWLEFLLLTDVGGTHLDESETLWLRLWSKAAYANALGLLYHHRGNRLNPKRSCWYTEAKRRPSVTILRVCRQVSHPKPEGASTPLPPLPTSSGLPFPPSSVSHPKTLPSAENCSPLWFFIPLDFISVFLISLPWHFPECPSSEGER